LNRPDDMESWTLQQCHITHHNPLSDSATLALGRMAAALILKQDLASCRQETARLLAKHPEFEFEPYPGNASGYIVDTMQTVLHYFFSTDSFEDCLITTVNQGGDADTTGALAGMLAGAKYGAQQIPERWLDRLDNGVTEHIRRQTLGLLNRS